MLLAQPAHAAKIELEFKGQKQVVEFDPKNPKDVDRAEKLWTKADYKKFYVYSETGTFRVFEEPRENAKSKEIGNWYQELSTSSVTSPYLADLSWDKKKWHPRFYFPERGWLKLDDPYIIWPQQLKPVRTWPIRYFAYFGGEDTAAAEEGVKPKYDPYVRYQFDREGYLLNNRTLERMKTIDGWWRRMFQYRDFIHLTPVWPRDPETPIFKDGGPALSFNLKQFLADPKLEYDEHSGYISVWASFDDPVKSIYDKNNNACVINCKNRKRWAP